MTEQPRCRVLADLEQQSTALGDRISEVCKGFAQLSGLTMTTGNLGRSTKELTALAIGAAKTRDQATGHEVVRVTVLMHGGPPRSMRPAPATRLRIRRRRPRLDQGIE